jgi:hypothetical protein
MRKVVILAVLSAALLAPSCAGEEDPSPASPTSAFPGGSPATGPTATNGSGAAGPTGSGPTGSSGSPTGASGLPTTSPGAGTGTLTAGSIAFGTRGDVEADGTLTQLAVAVYTPPPGGLALVWTAGGADATTIGIGGTSFTGSRRTAPTLTLTITLQTPDAVASFLSIDGECEVTIDRADEHALQGGFECTGLTGDDGTTVDVSATFEAAG